MALEALTVKMGLDAAGVLMGLRNIAKGVRGLKQESEGMKDPMNSERARQQLNLLERQIALNKKRMAEYQEQAQQLRDTLSGNIDTTQQQAQIENLMAKVESANQKIAVKQGELAGVKERNTDPFGKYIPTADSEAQIAKLNGEIARLMELSDQAAAKVSKLDGEIAQGPAEAEAELLKVESAMLQLERNTGTAADKALKLREQLDGAGRTADKTATGLAKVAKEAKEAGEKGAKHTNFLSKALHQAFKRVVLMAAAYKLIRTGMKYLLDGLKANKQFAASFNAIKVNLATAFQPIYEFILPAINKLMAAFASVTQAAATFISALFGKTYKQSKDAAKGLQDSKKAMEGYGKSAEKARGQLASFDKFNDITPQQDAGGGGGVASEGMAFDAVEEPKLGWMEKLKELLASMNIDLTPLTNGLNKLKEVLALFDGGIGAGLQWLWDSVLAPMAKWTMEQLIPSVLEALASALKVLQAVIEPGKEAFLWLWETFLKPLAAWTGGIIVDVLQWIKEKLDALAEWITANQALVRQFLIIVGLIGTAFLACRAGVWAFHVAINLLKPVLAALCSPAGIFALVVAGLTAIVVWAGNGEEMIESLKDTFEGLITFLQGAFTGDWKLMWEGLQDIFRGVFNGIVIIAESCLNFIVEGINKLVVNGLNKLLELGKFIGIDIQIPNIPKVQLKCIPKPSFAGVAMATGGIAYGQVSAIVGDNFNARQNPEVISPLSDLQQMITAAVLQRDIAGGNGGGEITLKLVLENGSELVHALIDPMNKTAKNLGYAPVFKVQPKST